MRLSPTRIIDGLLRTGGRRLSVRALTEAPEGVDLGPLEPRLPARLMTRSKRVDLAQELALGELPRVLALADAAGSRRTPTSCCSSGDATSATTTPGCTTPSG